MAEQEGQQHSPEPWETFADGYRGHEIRARDNNERIAVGYIYGAHDAHRVRAAVNACAGLATSGLEQGVISELIAALEEIVGWVPNAQHWHTDAPVKAIEAARAALAKARGVTEEKRAHFMSLTAV